jgi:succinyl-CoA synthetase alpha subunit
MNTTDALVHYGGQPANFLDTGGKATSETVKESFRIILADERVKAVFVNICGGLTDCGMIARGILLAFEELGVKVPVVVRLRGTNEDEGERVIRGSGLRVEVERELDVAARRVVALAAGKEV